MFKRKHRKVLQDEDSYFFDDTEDQQEQVEQQRVSYPNPGQDFKSRFVKSSTATAEPEPPKVPIPPPIEESVQSQAMELGIDQEQLQSYYQEYYKIFNQEMEKLKNAQELPEADGDPQEEEEVDPLDAFMAENDQEYLKDMSIAVVKTKAERSKESKKAGELLGTEAGNLVDNVPSFMEEEEPAADYMNEMGKRAVEKQLRNNESNQKDFLDSDGEIDYDAIRHAKKKDNKKFTDMKELDHEQIGYKKFRKDFYFESPEIANLTHQEVKEIRKNLNMKVKGKNVLNPILNFDQLNFDERFYRQIAKQKFTQPTPIQSQGLPLALKGRDVIGIAKTGSGKTLSYIWPLLIHVLDQDPVKKSEGPIGLIMCPTRELCQQVYIETKRYGRKFDLKISVILGGESKHQQWRELRKGVEILIATPGRLIDLYKKKAFDLKKTSFVVIDEADRMFGMGFEPQMKAIMNQIRPDRQTLLYSATFHDKVRKLCLDYLNDAVHITIGGENLANEDIKQEVVIFKKIEDKMEWLLDSIDNMVKNGKVLIFVNHIKSCNDLKRVFDEFARHLDKVVLHGDKLQYERTNIIRKFKKDAKVMIATDVASRGLDIPSIKFVINYENPKDFATYVHRIGRTGRAGNKDGVAITCVMRKEWRFAAKLAKQFDRMGLAIPPDLHDLASRDSSYQEIEFKRKMGYKKGANKSSQMLQRALNAGQKDKKGLGFSKKKKDRGKKDKKTRENEAIQGLYGDNRSINDQYREMVNIVEAEEFKIKTNQLYGKDKKVYTVKKRVSRFGNIGEECKRDKFVEVQVSAAEYEKIKLDEKRKEMKNKLKDKFRNSFVKKGFLDVGKKPE